MRIIDWVGAGLAPREVDLRHFVSNQPEVSEYFLRSYERHAPVQLDPDALSFCLYHRYFEDFVDGAWFVLTDEVNDEELNDGLESVLWDSVYNWRGLEDDDSDMRDRAAHWMRALGNEGFWE